MGLYKYQGRHRIRLEVPRTPTHIRKVETMTEALKKDYEKTCQERIDEQWQQRQEDLKEPWTFEGLGFDYVEPHTFTDQLEGYWRWQFSWGGPATSFVHMLTRIKKSIA